MKIVVLVLALFVVAGVAAAQDGGSDGAALGDLRIDVRWVFTMTNLAREDALRATIDLMKRAKQAGYNGMLVCDSKFSKFQLQDKSYAKNVGRLRTAFSDEGMQLAVNVCPMGYAAELLAADPNLAEGMPVRNAAFVVKEGRLAPVDEVCRLVNGALEKWKGDSPVGWTVDRPGAVSFYDEQVTYEGRPTLRQDHSAAKGPVRLIQTLKVQPWRYYHISVAAKTEDCNSKDFRIFALSGDPMQGYSLNWQPPEIKQTMDWTRLHATFCSADNTEVNLYIGSYNPKKGNIWWSDIRMEPAGFVNVIRRESLPLTITSEDGKTAYMEGKDFAEVSDPKLGNDPNPGYFSYWHDAPTVTVPQGSFLKEGQRVLASYHFATLAGKSHQINCCFSEPKVYDLIARQVAWVKETATPDVYMLGHDEIRHAGWDDTCARRNMTCGQILADNIAKCAKIVEKTDPKKPVMTWNDMFDPFHNAHKEGWMYLAKAAGPWYGSWEGLPRNVIIMNWHNNAADSLKFFADRGNPQVLAGFYDDDPKKIIAWLEMAAQVRGVRGVMYTTWVNDYSKLEQFMDYVNQFEAHRPAAAGKGRRAR